MRPEVAVTGADGARMCRSRPAAAWQDNPLAWTYTTIHTRLKDIPPPPAQAQNSATADRNIVFVARCCPPCRRSGSSPNSRTRDGNPRAAGQGRSRQRNRRHTRHQQLDRSRSCGKHLRETQCSQPDRGGGEISATMKRLQLSGCD